MAEDGDESGGGDAKEQLTDATADFHEAKGALEQAGQAAEAEGTELAEAGKDAQADAEGSKGDDDGEE